MKNIPANQPILRAGSAIIKSGSFCDPRSSSTALVIEATMNLEALAGLDEALMRSAETSRLSLKELASKAKELNDTEVKQEVARLRAKVPLWTANA